METEAAPEDPPPQCGGSVQCITPENRFLAAPAAGSAMSVHYRGVAWGGRWQLQEIEGGQEQQELHSGKELQELPRGKELQELHSGEELQELHSGEELQEGSEKGENGVEGETGLERLSEASIEVSGNR